MAAIHCALTVSASTLIQCLAHIRRAVSSYHVRLPWFVGCTAFVIVGTKEDLIPFSVLTEPAFPGRFALDDPGGIPTLNQPVSETGDHMPMGGATGQGD